MGKQITINDPLRLLPPNPDSWPDDLKAAIRKCCCGGTSSPPPTVTWYPFNCCGGTGTNNDFLPGNFSIRIGGTLSHDGTYGVKHWPYQTLPEWYPLGEPGAPAPPNAIVPVAGTEASFVSDLYEDFSVSGTCTFPPSVSCPNQTVYNDWTFDFFYYVYYESCAVWLGQIYRYTEHIHTGLFGTPSCPPRDFPPTHYWNSNVFMVTDLNAPCRDINCKPIRFKFPLKKSTLQPIFGTIVSVQPYCMGGLPTIDFLHPGTVIEPGGTCSNGSILGPFAEIVL